MTKIEDTINQLPPPLYKWFFYIYLFGVLLEQRNLNTFLLRKTDLHYLIYVNSLIDKNVTIQIYCHTSAVRNKIDIKILSNQKITIKIYVTADPVSAQHDVFSFFLLYRSIIILSFRCLFSFPPSTKIFSLMSIAVA